LSVQVPQKQIIKSILDKVLFYKLPVGSFAYFSAESEKYGRKLARFPKIS
jgi:hypothetical protein